MKGKSMLTEKEYEIISQRLDILASAITVGDKEKESKSTENLKVLTQEAIQYLRRLT
jgi:hypothetical protein